MQPCGPLINACLASVCTSTKIAARVKVFRPALTQFQWEGLTAGKKYTDRHTRYENIRMAFVAASLRGQWLIQLGQLCQLSQRVVALVLHLYREDENRLTLSSFRSRLEESCLGEVFVQSFPGYPFRVHNEQVIAYEQYHLYIICKHWWVSWISARNGTFPFFSNNFHTFHDHRGLGADWYSAVAGNRAMRDSHYPWLFKGSLVGLEVDEVYIKKCKLTSRITVHSDYIDIEGREEINSI